jgi:hypothetical protein
MSEEVGVVEREALDRAREQEAAFRRGYFARLERVAELTALGAAAQTGDRNAQRLLQSLWRVDHAEAARLVDEAADLTPRVSLSGGVLPARLPATAMVLAAGQIGPGHVAVIRRTMGRLDKVETVAPAPWAHAEQELAQAATTLSPRGLDQVAKQLLAHLDPDGVAPDEREERFDGLRLTARRDGSLWLRAVIRDAVDAELIREGFDAASTPAGPDDDRTLENRQAAALKEFVLHATAPGGLLDTDTDTDTDTTAEPEPEGARTAVRSPGRPVLTVTIDHRWLQLAVGHGTLESGALADTASIRRWACDAGIVPMLLATRSEPLDVGRLSYTVPEGMRRALIARDGGCAFPGCTRRPRRCHAHHVEHWVDGGSTCLENLVLLCRFHHQLVHHRHWTITITDGRPVFTPPPWVDPQRRPRPGGRPRVAA